MALPIARLEDTRFGVKFAPDSLLEGAVCSEPVSGKVAMAWIRSAFRSISEAKPGAVQPPGTDQIEKTLMFVRLRRSYFPSRACARARAGRRRPQTAKFSAGFPLIPGRPVLFAWLVPLRPGWAGSLFDSLDHFIVCQMTEVPRCGLLHSNENCQRRNGSACLLRGKSIFTQPQR
jgi:hypothetical protein